MILARVTGQPPYQLDLKMAGLEHRLILAARESDLILVAPSRLGLRIFVRS
jgi:hypothetical protein